MSCGCLFNVSLSRGVMCWSVVCDLALCVTLTIFVFVFGDVHISAGKFEFICLLKNIKHYAELLAIQTWSA